MLKFLSVFLILSLAACSIPPRVLKIQPGYQLGQYAIKQFAIVPATPETGQDPEYLQAQTMLEQAYPWETLGEGLTPEASLTLKIVEASLEINTARAILVGDSFRIVAQLELRELATNNLISEDVVFAVLNQQQGLLGVVVDGVSSEDARLAEKRMLVRQFVTELRTLLYPKNKNLPQP